MVVNHDDGGVKNGWGKVAHVSLQLRVFHSALIRIQVSVLRVKIARDDAARDSFSNELVDESVADDFVVLARPHNLFDFL